MNTSFSEQKVKSLFSANLRHLMKQGSISEIELSKRTLISQSAINRIKKGVVCPSLYQALAISDAFNEKVESLLLPCAESTSVDTYAPIISLSMKEQIKPKEIVGFVEQKKDWGRDVIGFKVGANFKSSLINENSVLMVKIPDEENYSEGDTLLLSKKNEYIVGALFDKNIKPLDDLSRSIPRSEVTIIGKVVSIESKYVKDKSSIKDILSNYRSEKLDSLLSTLQINLKLKVT